MKYMMMMHAPGKTPYQIASWPQDAIKTHIGYMVAFNERLKQAGELVGAEGLAGPDQAKLVRGGDDGKPVTDGVFPEAKEFLVGYWIVEVETPERAYELAAYASMAPGGDGKPLHLPIEVRQVLTLADAGHDLP